MRNATSMIEKQIEEILKNIDGLLQVLHNIEKNSFYVRKNS